MGLMAGCNVVAYDVRPSQVMGTLARVAAFKAAMKKVDADDFNPLDGRFFRPINRMMPQEKDEEEAVEGEGDGDEGDDQHAFR